MKTRAVSAAEKGGFMVLHLLRCPICQAGLRIADDDCSCERGHVFPVERGVPNIMLRNTQTADHYSFQWGKELDFYKAIRESQGGILKATASSKLGWDDYLPDLLADSSSVLDVACGYGGIADIVKRSGFLKTYLGFDINDTLADVKKERFAELETFQFVRADMTDAIYAEVFDLVVCRSAIMYAPEPRKTFASIAGAVRPGGHFAISAYTRKSPMREMCDDYFRDYFSKLPEREAFEALQEFTLFGKILSELEVQVDIPEDLPVLQIKKGTYDVQRLVYYHFLKCFWNPEWGFHNSTIVNFDWYHPEYSWRFTKEEVAAWYDECGFDIVQYRMVPAQHFFCGRKRG
jgi:SAM-dependent methyltransferase